jgi:3-phenylpropionate/cinnamic acid dioxygenase small subunit
MIESDVLARIDSLQLSYAGALDERDMDGWLATFADDPVAAHICTSIEAVKAGEVLAMMLDDCRARLEDRVTFITRIWAGTFQDYQTRHVLQRVSVRELGQSRYQVRTNFIVAYTPEETGQTALLASGYYDDTVIDGPDGARFLTKKAVMDASVLPHYLVYPL